MKKYNIFSLFFLMLLSLLAGCSKEEKITFDSELPRFDLRPDYQLLEVIVPQGTLASDNLYIVGEFNGGVDVAVGDPRWQLEKASDTDVKWGIYLNPDDFVEGKTLADGYTFYSVEQGEERSLENTPVIHTEAPAVGARINVLLYRWAEYFNKPANPEEIVHDGYVIYVVDNSGYDELALYAWVDDPEPFGGWPGMTPTGKVEIDGVTYKYFDTKESNKGRTINLIFNNNDNGKQLADYPVTLDQDFYLEVTPDGVVEFDPSSAVTHDGYALFVVDNSGWDELWLYMWGTTNDLCGTWPGMPATGTQVINGVTYTYFDLGAANCDAGLEEHLILNNNNGKQIDDVVVFTLDRDVYVELTASGATEIDPNTYVPGGAVEPEPEPEPTPGVEYKIYVVDNSGYDELALYAYENDAPVYDAWPGMTPAGEVEINGVNYKYFNAGAANAGHTIKLIFNNNGNNKQLADYPVTLNQDFYLELTPEGVTELDPVMTREGYVIYVVDNSGYDELALYAYENDAPVYDAWPGIKPTGEVKINGVNYKYFDTEAANAGHTIKLIFNNNGNNKQLADYPVTLNQDFYLELTPEGVVEYKP